jgi:hypothetical protein
MTLPAMVMRGADALTTDRRSRDTDGMHSGFFGYTVGESEDDPFDGAALASDEASSTDDAPITILGGLVHIQPKLARLLGLTKSQF